MLARLKADLRRLARQQAERRPASTPGILTCRTSRGVTRRPMPKLVESTIAGEARWS